MRTLKASDKTVRIEAVPQERVWLINRMKEARQFFQTYQDERVRGLIKIQLESAWMDIPLDGVSFCDLIDKRRDLLERHNLRSRTPHRHGRGRIRGRLDPQDLDTLLMVAQATTSRRKVSRRVLADLLDPSRKPAASLNTKILGFSRYLVSAKVLKSEEELVDPYNLLHRENRPSDAGHSVQSQVLGEREHQDSGDYLLEDSEEVTQPTDIGQADEPDWLSDIVAGTNQDEAGFVDDTRPSIEDVPESEREFLADLDIGPAPDIDGVDESGDSYLADIGVRSAGDGLVDYQPWEQDDE